MRYIFTFLMVVSWVGVFGQRIEQREYSDSSGSYLVEYSIDPMGVSIMPLVGYAEGQENPNKAHEDATITVYKIKVKSISKQNVKAIATLGFDTIIVGKPFKGQYVEGGCFEDRPEDMVNHAKKLQSEMKKPKRQP